MKKELIFLGAPASGKGTQTKKLAKQYNLPHIDTGSMLRAATESGSEYGKIAKQRMDNGQLVPAEIVVGIIRVRLMQPDCSKGFILDGFPRSMEQAVELDKILPEINADKSAKIMVINIDVSHDVLVERIVNRRMCSDCGAIYNLKFFPPQDNEKCDKCKKPLVQRKDDTQETALKRLKTYKNETQPLIKFYEDKGWLYNVNGNQSIDEIFGDIKSLVENNND